MKSNYKRIGDYIEEVDIRNQRGQALELWGVSIDKKFIKSVANIIGTDLSKYKIVSKNCFVCSLMQVSRDEKIPVARWDNETDAIVSPAYKVFKIKDEKSVLPKYVDLWFKRAEFDREASYYGVGGVRGSLEWGDFCDMKLPIPSIEEQQKIVDAYETIEKRIAIKKKINENLVGFSKCRLHNFLKQNSEIERIPLYKLCVDIMAGGTPSRSIPEYWNRNDYQWVKNGEVKNNIIIETEEYISKEGFSNSSAKLIPPFSILMAMYCVSMPQLAINIYEVTTNQAVCAMICKNEEHSAFLYYYLMFYGQELINNANGSAQINLSKETIAQYLVPNLSEDQLSFLNLATSIRYRSEIVNEIRLLTSLQTDLIAQLSR